MARNESSLRAGRLELLKALVTVGGAVEGGEQLAGFFGYFSKQVDAALAGRPQDINVKSDRLLWLLYAMGQQISDRRFSREQALAILSKPQHRDRISHLSLVFMLEDFADSIGTPNQPSPEYVLLILECALMSADEPAVAGAAGVVIKLDVPKDPLWLVDVIDRARAFLSARGRQVGDLNDAASRYQSRFVTRVADDDL